jgi:hypothetical protein
VQPLGRFAAIGDHVMLAGGTLNELASSRDDFRGSIAAALKGKIKNAHDSKA